MNKSEKIPYFCLISVALIVFAYYIAAQHSQISEFSKSIIQIFGYISLGAALLFSVKFQRSSPFFIILTLLLFQYLFIDFKTTKEFSMFLTKNGYHISSIAIPLSIVVFAFVKEKGFFSKYALIRLGFVAFWFFLIWAIVYFKIEEVYNFLKINFLKINFISINVNDFSLIIFLICLIFLFVKLVIAKNNHIKKSYFFILLSSYSIFFASGGFLNIPLFFMVSSLIFILAILQDSYNMAYKDTLTKISNRRALEEEFARLGNNYTLAMLDVDHFKKFNDTYGHDAGDEVLQIVAAEVSKTGGGAKTFRYGGEEFTIVFEGKTPNEAKPFLEETRERIANHPFIIRDKSRPKEKPKNPLPPKSPKKVQITVSMGAAERNDRAREPFGVMKEADKALYRAKEEGRNRVVLAQ